jgi:hypothetical protein
MAIQSTLKNYFLDESDRVIRSEFRYVDDTDPRRFCRAQLCFTPEYTSDVPGPSVPELKCLMNFDGFGLDFISKINADLTNNVLVSEATLLANTGAVKLKSTIGTR